VGDREVWIEVKSLPPAFDNSLLAVLDKGPCPLRYAVHSFDHRIIYRLGESRPSQRRGILVSAYLQDPVSVMRGAGATTLWQDWQQVDQELVTLVHDAGGPVIAWTVNELGDLDRMVRFGVDGLCGNYPDRIRVAIAPKLDQASRTWALHSSRCSHRVIGVSRGSAAAAWLVQLPLQASDVILKIIDPQHQRINPASLNRSTPFPAMHEKAQIARSVIPAPTEPEYLDLELSLVQSCLCPLPECFELLVQAIEEWWSSHLHLLSDAGEFTCGTGSNVVHTW
jgi:Glycerophosphoryl diester phosphodiesterase family